MTPTRHRAGKHLFLAAGLVCALAVLGGCGRDEPDRDRKPSVSVEEDRQVSDYLEALRRRVQVQQEVVAILKGVTDVRTRDQAQEALNKLKSRDEEAQRDVTLRSLALSPAAQTRVARDPAALEFVNLYTAEQEELVRIRNLNLPGGELRSLHPAATKPKSP
jgi:hypothetical protein